jgi:hypothetical protein
MPNFKLRFTRVSNCKIKSENFYYRIENSYGYNSNIAGNDGDNWRLKVKVTGEGVLVLD